MIFRFFILICSIITIISTFVYFINDDLIVKTISEERDKVEAEKSVPPLDIKRSQDQAESLHSSIDNMLNEVVDVYPQVTKADLGNAIGVPQGCRQKIFNLEAEPNENPIILNTIPAQMYKVNLSLECDKITYQMDGLVVVPHQNNNRLVVAIHGTAGSPEHILGQYGYHLSGYDDYHHSFALRYAQDGYVVFAPRIVTGFEVKGAYNLNFERDTLDKRLEPFGLRLIGLEVEWLSIAASKVKSHFGLSDVGVHGISLGGLLSFYTGALNSEINTIIVSSWSEGRLEKLSSRKHKTSMWRYLHGGYTVYSQKNGKVSDHSISRDLIYPRRLMMVNGSQDDRSEYAVGLSRFLNEFYESDDYCFVVAEGGHEIFYEISSQFMNNRGGQIPCIK